MLRDCNISTQQEHGVTVCDEITYFAAAMEKYLAAFVEEELVEKFGRLMSFIRATETAYGLQRSGGVDGDIVSAVVDEDDEKPSLLVRAEAKLEPGDTYKSHINLSIVHTMNPTLLV